MRGYKLTELTTRRQADASLSVGYFVTLELTLQYSKEKLIKMLKSDPKNPKTLNMLGKLYMSQSRVKDAIDCFSRASVFAPKSVTARINLGNAYMSFGKIEAAHEAFSKAIELDSDNADAVYNYASSFMALGEFEAAIELYEKVLVLNEGQVVAASAAIAEAMEKMGSPEQAFEKIDPFLKQDDSSAEIAGALSQLVLNHEQFGAHVPIAIEKLQAVAKSTSLDKSSRARAFFKLGQLYRKKQNYAESFKAFKSAHELVSLHYDIAELEENVAKLKKNFAEVVGGSSLSEKYKNIFVMGMPRSGTSLIDKIVGVNPHVLSLGECNFFHHSVCEVSDDEDISWGSRPVEDMDLSRVRSTYKQKYLVGQKPSRFFLDKSLENVFLVGQLLQVLPDARIIWTRRDLRDVCLSCYSSDFAGRHLYAHDLRTLARYALIVEDLMSFWEKVFPQNIHVVHYESFVEMPEKGIRSLIHFLGFPWDDKYLASHKATNRVKTLSYNDVQKPVYRNAVGKWQNYKEDLAPLLEVLNSVAN